MNLFEYEKIGPEILPKLRNRTENGIVVDARIPKIKECRVCSSRIYDSINICIHFVPCVYAQKHIKAVSVG